MRRHVVRMGRRRSDLGIHTCSAEAFLRQNRIVVAMNDVVRNPWMMWLSGKYRFQDFSAFPLVGERLVRFRCRDGERQRMKDRSFIILRISGLQGRHLLFKGLAVRI